MFKGRRKRMTIGVLLLCVGCVLPCFAREGFLTIPEIQYTASPDGSSPYNGQVVNCAGGIVVFMRAGGRPRLVLQDPNAPDGWAGIQVKGWTSDAFADVNLGDWVEIEQTFVEENRGTTFLQYWDQNPDGSQPLLRIVTRGHELPRPIHVDVKEIAAPVYGPQEDLWAVTDYRTERFESMVVQVRDVVVAEQGLGKAMDNYALRSFREPNDPNVRCWVSDYFNLDLPKTELVLPAIEAGRRFRAVTGMIEQYTSLGDGYDYYQLLTLHADSVVGICPADQDLDGDVDLWDYSLFTEQLLSLTVPVTGPECLTADLNCDGTVDMTDLDLFNAAWQGADANGDGIVDGDDLD